MAKRFIDTNLFSDEWFQDLSKDGKLFFIYFITNCDHAGIVKINKKLIEFQTGIKDIERVIKELGNCLVTVKENVFFMPKFIKFQYPNFPQSNVKQQLGAINILKLNNLWNEESNSYLTLSKELNNSYDIVIDNVNEYNKKGIENFEEKNKFDFGTLQNDFIEKWNVWIKFKKQQFNQSYKSEETEQTAINDLIQKSKGDCIIAEKIINQSISNLWKGLFTLKIENQNGNKQQLTTIEKQRNSYEQLDKLFDAQLNKSNINFSGGIPPQ